MSRGVVLNLLTSGLIILATLALLGAATVITEAPLAATVPVVGEESVYEFYDAVNTVLRTGDPRGLDRVTVPNLVVHTSVDTVLPEPAELAATLLAIHAIAPELQLSVQEVAVAGDRVIVQLLHSNTAPVTWLGAPVGASLNLWGSVDTLRFEGDRVVEFWSGASPAPQFSVLGSAVLDTMASSNLLLSVRRLSSGAGDTWAQVPPTHPRVICVEAGGFAATIEAPSNARTTIATERAGATDERVPGSGSSATVVAGETLTLASGVSATLHAAAELGPFRAYDVSFPRYHYTGPLQDDTEGPDADSGQQSSPLIQDPLLDAAPAGVPPGTLEIACGRLVLPPHAALSLGASAGSLMLAVEAGTLDLLLRAPSSEAVVASSDAWGDSPRAMILTRHEDAVLAPAGATATLLAGDEPVHVIAIAVRPQQVTTPS